MDSSTHLSPSHPAHLSPAVGWLFTENVEARIKEEKCLDVYFSTENMPIFHNSAIMLYNNYIFVYKDKIHISVFSFIPLILYLCESNKEWQVE